MNEAALRRLAWIALLVCAVLPRLLLAITNSEANDPHDEVIRLILETGRAPLVDDCWACYQPKLFHHVAATAIRAFDVRDSLQQIKLAQGLNFVAALGTLVVLWRMARRLPGPPAARQLAFALVALNPRFNAITAQATNDSFAVLFGVSCVYAFWRAWQTGAVRYTATAIACVVLMSLTKTSGVVYFAMFVTLLGVKVLVSAGGERRRVGLALLALVLVYGASVPFLGQYDEHYREKGDPFAANWERMPAPDWFEQSLYRRPGVRSIADGYFSFRILDMLRRPWVGHGWCRSGDRRLYEDELLPTGIGDPWAPVEGDGQQYDPRCAQHRTSVWSQLYGRAQAVRFAGNPGSWRTLDPLAVAVSRSLLALGLLPLAVFVLGLGLELRDLFRGVAREGPAWLARDDRWVLLALLGGSLLIVAQLAYLMRDFSSIKPIYVFPALGCFLAVFLRGFSELAARLRARASWLRALYAAHVLVLALYVLDLLLLVRDLAA